MTMTSHAKAQRLFSSMAGSGRKTLFLSGNSWGPIERLLSELASFGLGEANPHIFTNAPAAP